MGKNANEMGNPFFDFIKYRPKRSNKKKIKNGNYIVLYEKNAFRFDFGPRKAPQTENIHFHFHAFLERFGSYLTKSKNGFPIAFSNLAQKGSGFFFKLGS